MDVGPLDAQVRKFSHCSVSLICDPELRALCETYSLLSLRHTGIVLLSNKLEDSVSAVHSYMRLICKSL